MMTEEAHSKETAANRVDTEKETRNSKTNKVAMQ